jgi:hypothetical protein
MIHGHETTLGLESTLGYGYILVWKQSTVLHSLANRCVIHDGVDCVELETKYGEMKNKEDK